MILFTFFAVLLWSLVNIADNYLVERNKQFGQPIGSLVIFSSLFGFIAALFIGLLVDTPFLLSLQSVAILFFAGFCNLLWIVFYLSALKYEDVSSVIPWFLTAPLFAYILGYFILGESLSTKQIIGGGIILVGGFFLSIKSSAEAKKKYAIKWKPIIYMTIASLLIALWGVLFKYVAKDDGFWVSSFWEHIGLGVAGVVVVIFVRNYRYGFLKMLQYGGRSILAINLFSETATIIGNLLANYALLLAPVAVIYLLEVAQPMVVFILGIFCTLFFPKILKEDISAKNLVQKFISIGIMIVGAIFIV